MNQNPIVTPSHLFQQATQPLWIWYDLFGDPSHKEPISDFAMKLQEDGVAHEEQVVQDMPIKTVLDAAPDIAAQTTLIKLLKAELPLRTPQSKVLNASNHLLPFFQLPINRDTEGLKHSGYRRKLLPPKGLNKWSFDEPCYCLRRYKAL